MATIGSVTRQIAALEISSKGNTQQSQTQKPATSTRPGHVKQPSQTNVAKLLNKFAAPASNTNSSLQKTQSTTSLKPALKSKGSSSSLKTITGSGAATVAANGMSKSGIKKPTATTGVKKAATAAEVAAPTPSPPKTPAPGELDIGRYDGGFEKENETRGEAVHGEAAEQLALDSSSARYVYSLLSNRLCQ